MKYIVTFADNSIMHIEAESHHYNLGTIIVFYNNRIVKSRKKKWFKKEEDKREIKHILNLNTVKLISFEKHKK